MLEAHRTLLLSHKTEQPLFVSFVTDTEKEPAMLWTVFVILLVLWLIGVVSSYTLGGFIHILLLLALITLIFNLISGRRSAV